MIEEEIAALAMSGATTFVEAMATEAWASARNRIVEFFRRRNPERQAEVEAQLDSNAALVTRAADAERARAAVTGPWQFELEEILARSPEAREELHALTAEIQTALPRVQQWVQHNTARDHATLYAVQHGVQHIHYMDNPRSAGAASEESAGQA